MSSLTEVTTGLVVENDFELIYGVPKIGKTTFACQREKALLMDIENGSRHIKNISRLPRPSSFSEVIAQLRDLIKEKHPYKTLIVDSLDHLEPMVNADACAENAWKVISDGAFGKGGDAARQRWGIFIALLKELRSKMHIVLIAHSQLRAITDPMKQSTYDKHDLKLQEKTAALFKETVDAILFCTYEVLLKESKGAKSKILNNDEPQRFLLTQGRPGHEGGNRYPGLPYRILLDFEEYQKARANPEIESPENIRNQILTDLADLKDLELKERVEKSVASAKDDLKKLKSIYNKLQVVLANAA